MRTLSAILLLFLFLTNCAGEEYDTFEFSTGNTDLENSLVSVNIPVANLTGGVCLEAGGELIPAQGERITASRSRVWWYSNLPANESVEYAIRTDVDCAESEYTWNRVGDQSLRLEYNGQPLIQYEHPVFDYDNIEETKKPFHHVFSPASGEIITKGPGGLYSHHRGIFFGYNNVQIGDKQMDFWHANDGERTEHEEILQEFSGPVMGGHIAKIAWKDHDGEVMLEERRDIRAFVHSEDSFIIDFNSSLFAIAGLVRLGGDLQHAGVQFRAAQYVADNADETRFIRPADWADFPQDEELGEDDWNNLPWNAMQFNIEDDTYTVVYMSHPSNPGRTREMSERKYGRFGEFFQYQQSEGAPVLYKYRFWVIAGESPSVDEIDQMYREYSE